MKPGKIHIVIPDTQVRPDTPIRHLDWIGRYVFDEYKDSDVTVVHLGDHYDMASLSSYDKGTSRMEGRRYRKDIDAGNEALEILTSPMLKSKKWKPKLHFLMGNHENRITRAGQENAQLIGAVSLDDLHLSNWGWKVHPFLEPVWLDGVCYSHYFYNQSSGRPFGGMAETRLKTIGHSFVMGHQQGLQTAQRSVLGKRQRALIAGSCYLHSEEYRGPQAREEWRGILVLHQVKDGNYDLMEVSLSYLCKRYTGKTLRMK